MARRSRAFKYQTIAERLAVNLDTSGDCWLWTGSIGSHGYGQLHWRGNVVTAHRAMWELHHGTIPPGMDICHTCDVRACCRPEHLFIGTRLMNVRDCIAKKRNGAVTKPSSYRRGIRHHAAKLNPSQVADIRAIYQAGGVTKAMLARQYGIARTTLHSIVTYRTWK